MSSRIKTLVKDVQRAKKRGVAKAFDAPEIVVSYRGGANANVVSAYSLGVIKDILRAAGLTSAAISSTARSPREQAEAMYTNLQNMGVQSQLDLYKSPGDAVIRVYVASLAAGKNREQILRDMVAEIHRQGPQRVSRHCADHTKVNVIDIAPSSITPSLRAAFIAQVGADARVSRFLYPPRDNDPAYHLEIPQPAAAAQSLGKFYDDLGPIALSDNTAHLMSDAKTESTELFEPIEDAEAFEEVKTPVALKEEKPIQVDDAAVYHVEDEKDDTNGIDFDSYEEKPEKVKQQSSEEDYFQELKEMLNTSPDQTSPSTTTNTPQKELKKDPMRILEDMQKKNATDSIYHLEDEPADQKTESGIDFDALEQSLDKDWLDQSVSLGESGISITVIEDPGVSDSYNDWSAFFTLGEIRATSVSDMVTKVLSKAGTQKIKKLVINGHGSPGNISVGDGKGHAPNKHINGNRSEWEAPLTKLKGKFTEDALIFLRGCNTGAGKKGSAKLKELADFFQVTVKAPTGLTYPTSEESGSKHQVAKPGAAAPTPLASPSEIKKAKKASSKSLTEPTISEVAIQWLEGSTEFPTNYDRARKIDDLALMQLLDATLFETPEVNTVNLLSDVNAVLFIKDKDGKEKSYEVLGDYHLIRESENPAAFDVDLELRNKLITLNEDSYAGVSSLEKSTTQVQQMGDNPVVKDTARPFVFTTRSINDLKARTILFSTTTDKRELPTGSTGWCLNWLHEQCVAMYGGNSADYGDRITRAMEKVAEKGYANELPRVYPKNAGGTPIRGSGNDYSNLPVASNYSPTIADSLHGSVDDSGGNFLFAVSPGNGYHCTFVVLDNTTSNKRWYVLHNHGVTEVSEADLDAFYVRYSNYAIRGYGDKNWNVATRLWKLKEK